MDKYTEAELKDECLAWGNHYHNTCLLAHKQEDKSIQFDKWWDERNKPAKKIIDLKPLITSGIDCEFSGSEEFKWRSLGPLRSPLFKNLYTNQNDQRYMYCRPRMNHKMCHDGSKPIEGFVVKVYFDSVYFTVVNTSGNSCWWPHVKAIEYLEVEDGYAYPWEQAE